MLEKNPLIDRRHLLEAALAAGAVGAVGALAGCDDRGAATDETDGPGYRILSYYLSEPACIDPYNVKEVEGLAVDTALFDPLLRWDWEAGAPAPLAAEELPEVSDDGLTYTFHLRSGMTFHNGDPVDAAAFKRGWERIASPDMATPSEIGYHLSAVAGAAEMAAGTADSIEGITCPDELTLQVRLTAPMADFPAVCCHPGLSAVPQAALDDPATFLEQPIGNGPFMLDEPWQHNRYLSLSRFEGYYGAAPELDGIYFSILADPETAYAELQAGTLDIAPVPSGRIMEAVDAYGASDDGYTVTPGKRVLTGAELSTCFLNCNLADPVLADVDVRHAISCAINRLNIADALYEGTRRPADCIFPREVDDSDEDAWGFCAYDPDQANSLLDARYPRGADGSRGITLTLSYNAGAGNEDLMSAIQADLERVGITVVQESIEWAAYLDQLSDRSYQLARGGWVADYPTMDSFLYPNFFSTAANNHTGYSNPEVDDALLAARQIEDEGERRAAYRAVCRTVGADMPVIPLVFYAHSTVGSEHVARFTLDAQSVPHFDTAQLIDHLGTE